MYNKYSNYSYVAAEMKTANDNKVLSDLQGLLTLNDFNVIKEYISKTFDFSDEKYVELQYPNDVEVSILRDDTHIFVTAERSGAEFFNQGWKLSEKI